VHFPLFLLAPLLLAATLATGNAWSQAAAPAPPQHHLSPNQIKPNYAIAISAKLSLIRQR
jgi:hypothetical protein